MIFAVVTVVQKCALPILGSPTYEVINKSPIPVLVVPIETPDFAFKRVEFFTAYDDHELDALMALQQAINLKPHLSMLHFYTEGDDKPEKELARWQRKVEAAFPDWAVSCKAMRSEEHTSELQSLMRISYAVFCLKKKKKHSTPAKSSIM